MGAGGGWEMGKIRLKTLLSLRKKILTSPHLLIVLRSTHPPPLLSPPLVPSYLIYMLVSSSGTKSTSNEFSTSVFSPSESLDYGWHKKSNTWIVLNYTLIIAKYHIFTTSVSNGNLDFEGFLSRLKSKLTILRTIASTNNNLEQFTETWAAVL